MSLITEVCVEDGLSAIINLHDVPLARRFCPRILGLHEGRIVFDGPPSALNDEILTQVYGEEALESYVGAGSDGTTVGS
jgi:phosphonate transport system ATP-binding protein